MSPRDDSREPTHLTLGIPMDDPYGDDGRPPPLQEYVECMACRLSFPCTEAQKKAAGDYVCPECMQELWTPEMEAAP